MDEKSLPDLLSQLIPVQPEEDAQPEEQSGAEEQNSALAESLAAAAGQSDGPFERAVEEFLSGKGVLHDTAIGARTRGDTPADDVAQVLISQFKLSPTIATVISMLLVKLVPSIGKKPKKASPARKKARKETKPKAKAKTKPKAKVENGSEKKAKKKATAKPKTGAAKTAAKKKVSAKSSKKETASAAKKKKAK